MTGFELLALKALIKTVAIIVKTSENHGIYEIDEGDMMDAKEQMDNMREAIKSLHHNPFDDLSNFM